MAICVSRRNGRKTASQNKPLKRDYILLFISLAVFFGALTCFAWAVPSRSSPPDQDSSISSSASSNTQESGYTGKIASGQNQSASNSSSRSSSSSSSAGASNTASSRSSSAMPEPVIPPEESPASPVAETDSTQLGGTTTAGGGSEYIEYYEQEGSQSYRVIHHTAYQEYPVYTTVHHQASTPREVTINGTTRIEWTSCPVCGQQHSNSYNERVVDHVNEVYCAACGGQHSSSYDEVVYE